MGPTAKQFFEYIKQEIKDNPKTSWGKNEFILWLTEQYADFIERWIQ